MKKPQIHLLAAITLMFAAFTLGFFLGRNYNHSNVEVSVARTVVPTETTVATEDTAPQETKPQISFPIDINTAPKEYLMELPGIGEVIAQRIIDYREEHGDYAVVEDLLNVEGIGTKRLESILDLITTGG